MVSNRSGIFVLAAAIVAFGLLPARPASPQEDLRKDALEFFGPPLPERAPLPADNPYTKKKSALGRKLFHDARLSEDGKSACSSCHASSHGGAEERAAVVGHPWQSAPRNAPSIYNASLNTVVPMDTPGGDRTAPLRVEIRGGIDLGRLPAAMARRLGSDGGASSGSDFGKFPGAVLRTLEADATLMAEVKTAFPDVKPPLTAKTLAMALEVYLATLITPAPFDRFLAGDDAAIGPIEKIGLANFIDKGCVSCHGGPNFGGTSYETFAIGGDPVKPGQPAPLHRSAPLRNVALTPPYFHKGSVATLEGAVAAMLKLQTTETSLDGDVATIVAFLKTLNGTPPAAD